jgi:hypothetical protein
MIDRLLAAILRRMFSPDELAELRDGMAEAPKLVRGAGGLAARPLGDPEGPFARLTAAVVKAAGDAPSTARTAAIVPVIGSRRVAPAVVELVDVPALRGDLAALLAGNLHTAPLDVTTLPAGTRVIRLDSEGRPVPYDDEGRELVLSGSWEVPA